MVITDFLEPVNKNSLQLPEDSHPLALSETITSYYDKDQLPDLDDADLVIIGIQEDRNAFYNAGCRLAPDHVRKYLYRLFNGNFKAKIADLGNIIPGETIEDTYSAVKFVIASIIENNSIPVIIGGSQDLTYANYLAYESLGRIINIVTVDSSIDLGTNKDKINNISYLNAIFTHKPNYLFNFTNIGYQTYFVDQDALELMEKLYFDAYRLGHVRQNIEEVEPIVRNGDMLSFDISSIRQSDAPANANGSPNGFFGEEACRIVRYAGLSDKLSSIGFYELNPAFDKGEQTAHLVAQMIWYFIEGFYSRKNDFPVKANKDSKKYIKYVVSMKDFQNEITFYKSKISDCWWMEVPCPSGIEAKYERQHLVPCSYKDYQTACNEEIPNKWWQVYQKFL